jgi:adenylate cyclase
MFASAVDAVTCAVEVQEKMAERTASGAGPRILFRIGINVGVIIDGDDILGDGVNVAARVENARAKGDGSQACYESSADSLRMTRSRTLTSSGVSAASIFVSCASANGTILR